MKIIYTSEVHVRSKIIFLILGKRVNHFCTILFLISSSILFAQNHINSHWQFANGPYEASLNNISFDNSNSEIMYAGGTGAFRSDNGGEIWIDITPDTILGIGGEHSVIKADPNNSGIVYYGAGALFKSYNYGEDWEIIGFQSKSVSSINIDPINSNIIYIGLGNTTNNSIWKSTDGGETWEVKSSGIGSSQLPTQSCKAIKLNPLNNNSLIACVKGKGIYKSIDGADNWVSIWANFAVSDIEILPWDTTTILVASGALFKSTNYGLNWIQISDVNASCIEVDNITQDIYYGFHKTSDVGVTWDSLINPNLPTSFSLAMNIKDIRIKPGNNNLLYLATDVGIYKSTNKGLLWNQSFEGLNRFRTFDLRISSSEPNIIYSAGIQGIHKSSDRAKSWRYIGGSAYQNLITIHPEKPDIVFSGQVPILVIFYLWRTVDGGNTWERKLTDLYKRFVSVEFDPNNPDIVYAIASRLYKSTDIGDSWQIITVPAVPYSLQINPQNSSEIYLGTGGGLYKSTNGGEDWQYSGLPVGNNINVLISHQNISTIYATVYDVGFYISTDDGETWEKRNTGLTSNKFTQIKANPKITGQIFIGTEDDGIYYTNNSGDIWNKLEPEHPSVFINAISIDTIDTGRLLAAGMDVNGVYFLDSIISVTNLPFEEDVQLPHNFILYQNYPNPFNPVTQIRYSVPQEGLVILKIFDILGREVTTLVNEEKPAGEYSVDFNASSVNHQISSGVYFYSIIAGQFRMTRKMVLAK